MWGVDNLVTLAPRKWVEWEGLFRLDMVANKQRLKKADETNFRQTWGRAKNQIIHFSLKEGVTYPALTFDRGAQLRNIKVQGLYFFLQK